MKKNFMKASLSLAVTGMMALSMVFAGTKTDVNAEDTWTVSRSKTVASDTLDANNEAQITLSLPAKEEKLSSDVLFVMDVSSCEKDAEAVTANILSKLDSQIQANGATVKVGFVVFKGNAMVAYPLTDWNTAKKEDLAATIATKIADAVKNGTFHSDYTNMSSGLACAEDVLDKDTDVSASRKHMILVSDGATYLFCNGSKTTDSGYDYTSALTRVMEWKGTAETWYQDGTVSEWNLKYKVAGEKGYAQWTPSDWTKYLDKIGTDDAAENMSQYNVDFYKATASGTIHDNIMPNKEASNASYNPIINVEESFYQVNKIYQQMKAKGYDCNAYTTGSEVAPAFTNFMNYLAGGKADNITTINSDIFYLLSAGSKITDEMGTSANHAFSFVNDITKLNLTVDGKTYTATAATPENGETAVYLFNYTKVEALNGAAAPFVLHYYDGTDGTAERIVWDINVNVTELARVQLTYSEKLTTAPTAAGTYTLNTNNATTLNPVDSNSQPRAAIAFTSPVVNYVVARHVTPVTPDNNQPAVQPADTTNSRPTTPTTGETPNTGDTTNMPLAAGMMIASLLAIAGAAAYRRKFEK